ncbi:MAG: hypothetical protein U1F70_10800 [Candidatus Competibacteraceae bacterium]
MFVPREALYLGAVPDGSDDVMDVFLLIADGHLNLFVDDLAGKDSYGCCVANAPTLPRRR